MKKDLSDEAFRAVEDAARRIIDAYGKMPADASYKEYSSGDLTFIGHLHTIIIRYKGNEVMHTYMPGEEGKKVSVFYPDDWIDEVERIAQSIPKQER